MRKITLSQLFRNSSIGFLGAIALPSSFLINPALSNSDLAASINQPEQNPPSILIAPDNLIAQSSVLTPQEIQNRLVGQWQIQGVFFVPINIVFTSQGKGYLLTPFFSSGMNTKPTAFEFDYQIMGVNLMGVYRPLQIDIAQPGEEPIKTIFEFTSDGRIRVELVGINPGAPRPTEFTTGSILLNRVSNLTALPRNTEIVNSLETRIKTKEREGKRLVSSILLGQQAYFLEKEIFSTDIKELGMGIEDSQYDNYTFEIISSGDLRQAVFVTGTAKISGLRSFSGAVFIVKKGGVDDFQELGLCETIEPSMTPPAPPTLNGEKVQCAIGSRTPEEPISPHFQQFSF